MGIKTTIKYTTIANWLIAIGILNYAGPFASYNGSLLYIGMVGIVLIFFLNSKYFYEKKKEQDLERKELSQQMVSSFLKRIKQCSIATKSISCILEDSINIIKD